jgi:hypothetical protein
MPTRTVASVRRSDPADSASSLSHWSCGDVNREFLWSPIYDFVTPWGAFHRAILSFMASVRLSVVGVIEFQQQTASSALPSPVTPCARCR